MSDTLSLATTALDLPPYPPSRILLLRHGENRPRDGRQAFFLENADAVIAKTKLRAQSTPLVIDYEHQSHATKANGKPAPAAGWITALNADADGLWAEVEWTDAAKAAIKARSVCAARHGYRGRR